MNKFVIYLLVICNLSLVSSKGNLHFLQNTYADYPVRLIEGLLDSFSHNQQFPLIRKCLESDDQIENSFLALIKAVNDFKGENRNMKNLFFIVIDLGRVLLKLKGKYDECVKETGKETNFISIKIDDFFMNFPPNFRIYYQNYQNNIM